MTTQPIRSPGTTSVAIDWDDVRERLARVSAALEQTSGMSAERAREVLEQRARDLARPSVDAAAGDAMEIVAFQIASERYAIRAEDVVAVFALARLVPLPGATPPVAGITTWRGRLLTLIDVRAALGLSVSALNDLRTVLVLGDARGAAGILVDSVQTIASARLQDFDTMQASAQRNRYARGVSRDAIVLIDGRALANDHGLGGQE